MHTAVFFHTTKSPTAAAGRSAYFQLVSDAAARHRNHTTRERWADQQLQGLAFPGVLDTLSVEVKLQPGGAHLLWTVPGRVGLSKPSGGQASGIERSKDTKLPGTRRTRQACVSQLEGHCCGKPQSGRCCAVYGLMFGALCLLPEVVDDQIT